MHTNRQWSALNGPLRTNLKPWHLFLQADTDTPRKNTKKLRQSISFTSRVYRITFTLGFHIWSGDYLQASPSDGDISAVSRLTENRTDQELCVFYSMHFRQTTFKECKNLCMCSYSNKIYSMNLSYNRGWRSYGLEFASLYMFFSLISFITFTKSAFNEILIIGSRCLITLSVYLCNSLVKLPKT